MFQKRIIIRPSFQGLRVVMPLIAINLPEKLLSSIRITMENGHYQNIESFLEIAAYNQLALERGATPADVIASGHRKGPN